MPQSLFELISALTFWVGVFMVIMGWHWGWTTIGAAFVIYAIS